MQGGPYRREVGRPEGVQEINLRTPRRYLVATSGGIALAAIAAYFAFTLPLEVGAFCTDNACTVTEHRLFTRHERKITGIVAAEMHASRIDLVTDTGLTTLVSDPSPWSDPAPLEKFVDEFERAQPFTPSCALGKDGRPMHVTFPGGSTAAIFKPSSTSLAASLIAFFIGAFLTVLTFRGARSRSLLLDFSRRSLVIPELLRRRRTEIDASKIMDVVIEGTALYAVLDDRSVVRISPFTTGDLEGSRKELLEALGFPYEPTENPLKPGRLSTLRGLSTAAVAIGILLCFVGPQTMFGHGDEIALGSFFGYGLAAFVASLLITRALGSLLVRWVGGPIAVAKSFDNVIDRTNLLHRAIAGKRRGPRAMRAALALPFLPLIFGVLLTLVDRTNACHTSAAVVATCTKDAHTLICTTPWGETLKGTVLQGCTTTTNITSVRRGSLGVWLFSSRSR